LKRQFGVNTDSLPTRDDIGLAMGEALYDTPDYNSSPFTLGFRNRLEGWITQRGDPNVAKKGTQLHNRVHVWIGGNMLLMTSPNDPVFFLHHCFIDKVWSEWQANMAQEKPSLAPHYAPLQDGPLGHNLHDVLRPWSRKISDVMDIAALGYEYEKPALTTRAVRGERRTRVRSPFME
jgi:tyrosinase